MQKPSHPFQTQNSSPLLQSGGKSPQFSRFPESALKISILNFGSMDIMYNTDKHRLRMLRDWIPFGVCAREYWRRQIYNLGKIPHENSVELGYF